MWTTKLLTPGPLPRWFWPVLVGLNLLLHAPFFTMPPRSMHVWRQCNTMAVARNFYEEGVNILRPRVDRRLDTDGVTGMQFPAYEWLVAGSYHVFGLHEALPRLINWLIYLAGVVAFYYLVRQISGADWTAAVGAWSLAWSPELYYHGINALPDVLALTASVAGLVWFGRWRERPRMGWLLLSLLAVVLGGLTKLQFLVVGFPMGALVLRDLLRQRYTARQLAQLAVYAVVAVAVPLAWYAYARQLIATSGLADFVISLREMPDLATGWHIFSRNLTSIWPEVLLGYGSLVLLVVALGRLLRWAPVRHPWFAPGLAWAAGLLAYYVLELHQMADHTYYMLPLLPMLLLLAAWAATWLRTQRWGRPLLVVVLLVQPVWAFARIGYGRWLHQEPGVLPELYNPAPRAALEAATPAGARCLVGPDDSGCIDFYFLHKKGFGFDEPGQLLQPGANGQPYVAECIKRGARYLYTTDSLGVRDPRLQPYLSRKLTQVGTFGVWELRAASATR